MPGLKDVKDKISGVKKTAQITKAMNMVASAKLRGAQEKMVSFRPYASKFVEAMQDLSSGMESSDLPLMEVRDVKSVEIVVVTSDRGLCGSFNANIIKTAERLKKQYEASGKKVSFREISQNITEAFLSGESDQVDIVYGRFYSVASQKPETSELLPIKPVASEEGGKQNKGEVAGSYTYEPDPDEIMEVLLPLFLNVQVYRAMLEVSASEHAARMTAMDNATRACKDMIKDLTRLYNKARQAAVTGELMDIVGGAEALKG
jgi:F-type H+-transporting ATPase subunit gamma